MPTKKTHPGQQAIDIATSYIIAIEYGAMDEYIVGKG